MSEFINFVEKWPTRKNTTPERKLKLLQKALVLMEQMLILDPNNREFWKKKVQKIWSQLKDIEGLIIRLELNGKEILKESMDLRYIRDHIKERKEMM